MVTRSVFGKLKKNFVNTFMELWPKRSLMKDFAEEIPGKLSGMIHK
jgi:hypothetical protein